MHCRSKIYLKRGNTLGAGKASYQVVEQSRLELLNEFLAAVSEEREATFSAISLEDPSLTPKKVPFAVLVREIHNVKPIYFEVVDAKDPKISFQVHFVQGQEEVVFEIII